MASAPFDPAIPVFHLFPPLNTRRLSSGLGQRVSSSADLTSLRPRVCRRFRTVPSQSNRQSREPHRSPGRTRVQVFSFVEPSGSPDIVPTRLRLPIKQKPPSPSTQPRHIQP